jgi:hypothetical protein
VKHEWTDSKIEQALRELRNESADSDLWKDRVWSNIESQLGAVPSIKLEGSWAPWRGLRRWALAAACLMVALIGWQYRQKTLDGELTEYVYKLAAPMDVTSLEPEDRLAPDLFRGSWSETDPTEYPSLTMEGVYESI